MKIHLETERLILREWKPEDLPRLITIHKDPEVMQFLLPTSEIQTASMIERFKVHLGKHSFGILACEVKSSSEFIGWVGLNVIDFQSHFTPAVEIGWRLARSAWGKGYATEAARAFLEAGFNRVGLKEIVAFTVPANIRSRRVMEKIGLLHDKKGDFIHPKVPENHPLQQHVLYRCSKQT